MTEKRITSIAALIAAIGILLFGIASLIYVLRGPNCARPHGFPASFTYTSGSPMTMTPMGYLQSCTNKLWSRPCTNKLSPAEISAILNSLKTAETNLFANPNDLARAVANAVATNEQFKGLGINPEVVSNAIIEEFSRPEFQKDLKKALDDKHIKRLLEGAKINQTESEQIKIINSHP